VKVVLLYMAQISNEETLANYRRKLAPPLVTLAQSAQPEIQYVALRNISLVVQRDAALLASKIKVFFCKYNDPIYVKMEKLDILVRLANDRNVEQVLLELKEYAQEVDVEYVRRAVRTIGRCAIKLDVAAEKCIKVLLQLIQTKVNYVVQEAIVVIKDIFRTYPNRYESIIGVLCEALDTLDEPEAKASMIWILGEYADRIENAGELLEREFVDSFHDETPAVQLALLTACVKLFLKKPDTSEELVQRVLHMATEDSDNPDLRDRGYIYWRLLSSDPDAAKAVVLAEKPPIHDSTNTLEPALLSSLLANMSSLASVYHKAPESFIKRPRGAGVFDADEADEEEDFASDEEGDGAAAGGAGAAGARAGARAPAAPAAPAAAAAAVDDLDILGMGSSPAPAMPAPVAPTAVAGGIGIDDLLGDLGGGSASAPAPVSRPSPLSHPVVGEASGLKVHAAVVLGADGASPVLEMGIENGQASAVDKVAVALNRNAAGLAPVAAAADFSGVRPGAQGVTSVALKFDATKVLAGSDTVDVALRDNTSRVQVMFKVPLGLEALFGADGEAEKLHFPVEWPALSGPDAEVAAVVREVASTDLDAVSARLRRANVFHAARRSGAGGMEMEYVAARVHAAPGSALDGAVVFAELTFKAGVPMIKLVVKARAPGVAKLGWDALARLLATA
jgi:AP-1 complex subunit beta-1